jgi:hypothetical protein
MIRKTFIAAAAALLSFTTLASAVGSLSLNAGVQMA